jgi:alpha-aminoadipate/glutamate carrier protein LysW
MVNCPSCDAVIDVDQEDLDEGEVLTCDECGSTLNVVGLDPLELEVEDTGDEDEDEDEDEDLAFNEDDDEDEDEEEEEDEEE